MVRQITAFEAEDGTVHGTEFAAAQHDARKALSKLGIFNEGSVNAIIERRHEIHIVLDSLCATEEVKPSSISQTTASSIASSP